MYKLVAIWTTPKRKRKTLKYSIIMYTKQVICKSKIHPYTFLKKINIKEILLNRIKSVSKYL